MIAPLLVPVLMSVTGWAWLTPFTTAWVVAQLPLAVIVLGRLLESPPTFARAADLSARLVYRRPPVVIVMRASDVATMEAWRARVGASPRRVS